MKIILVFILSILSISKLISQNDAINYYPLKLGNVWVYQFSSSFGTTYKYKISITTTNYNNDHIYYSLDNKYIRVDSLNGNLYQLFSGAGCPYSVNERMTDSLASRLSDTARRNCGADINRCIDTNNRLKFGITMRTKHFIYQNNGNSGNVYARGFGIISGYGGSSPNFWGIELLGCVLNGVVYGDTSLLTGINLLNNEFPVKFDLSQNYPNPFNPATKIKFDISGTSVAQTFLSVFDILGKEVQVLVNQKLQPGTYSVDWDASSFPSGVYYYRLAVQSDRLEAGNFTETKKMVLIK